MSVRSLEDAHRVVDLDGDVHLWDFGGDGPLIVLIHGLGGSRSNWVGVTDAFARHGRVVVPDLVGFGDTPPLGRSSEVDHQVELVAGLITHLDVGPAIVVGNSMGGLIALLLASRHPEVVDRVVLVSAALPNADIRIRPSAAAWLGLPLLPGLGPKVLEILGQRRSPERSVAATMGLVLADPSRLAAAHREVLVEFARRRSKMPWAARAFADAARSIARILVSTRRFERAVGRVTAPVLILQGTADVVVRPASARWLAERRPDWPLELIEGVGHCPQLEVPDRFCAVVFEWLGWDR